MGWERNRGNQTHLTKRKRATATKARGFGGLCCSTSPYSPLPSPMKPKIQILRVGKRYVSLFGVLLDENVVIESPRMKLGLAEKADRGNVAPAEGTVCY